MIGPSYASDGAPGPATGRQGKSGEAIVAQAHGRYFEAASRGAIFTAASQGAGVATVTSISTTAILSLYNPANSKRRLALLAASLGYFSGTLGAGPIFHCANLAGVGAVAAPSSGTALTAICCNIGSQYQDASVTQAKTGSTVTAPTILRPFCSVNAILASTATGIFMVSEDLGGMFVIEPGYCYQIQSVCAAGSTPLVSVGVTWEEIPFSGTNG